MADFHYFHTTASGYGYTYDAHNTGVTASFSQHLLYAAPFFAGAGGNVDQLAYRGFGDGYLRVGIYRNVDTGLLYPGTLTVDGGSKANLGSTNLWWTVATSL